MYCITECNGTNNRWLCKLACVLLKRKLGPNTLLCTRLEDHESTTPDHRFKLPFQKSNLKSQSRTSHPYILILHRSIAMLKSANDYAAEASGPTRIGLHPTHPGPSSSPTVKINSQPLHPPPAVVLSNKLNFKSPPLMKHEIQGLILVLAGI